MKGDGRRKGMRRCGSGKCYVGILLEGFAPTTPHENMRSLPAV